MRIHVPPGGEPAPEGFVPARATLEDAYLVLMGDARTRPPSVELAGSTAR